MDAGRVTGSDFLDRVQSSENGTESDRSGCVLLEQESSPVSTTVASGNEMRFCSQTRTFSSAGGGVCLRGAWNSELCRS